MTDIELVEKMLADFEKDWQGDPAEDNEYTTARDVENFRKGMKYAYQYLLLVLKNKVEWIYDED